MESSVPFVHIKEISKTFRSQNQSSEALKGVSLDVYKGEFVVLVGPSGCGKSTLLNLIAGFDHPTQGSISVDGDPVRWPGPDRLMMFQEHALFPWLNVIDNVSFGLRSVSGMSHKNRRQRARELLKMVHLEDYGKAWIHELSGGMKHRVALARSLAPDPDVLLIDEPFAALDTLTKQHLYNQLQEIWLSTKKTIMSVTHDSAEAACLADRVLIFSPRPGEIKSQIVIDLPRPRDVTDYKVSLYARAITEQLEK